MLRGLLSFRDPYRILNFAWFAFFLTFVVWFNYAPFSTVIREDLHLTVAQARTVGLCNLALTIPVRIIIGMLLDRFGSRITYSALLVYAALPCWAFAAAQTFDQLVWSRLASRVTGQIAGNIGAYGSVGSVLYATTYSLLPHTAQGN